MDDTSWKERGTRRHFTVLLEVDATDFFENASVDWRYCMEHATFQHKDACEFLLHIGTDEDGDMVKDTVAKMAEFGCTSAFINAYRNAAQEGAVRVLFYS